MPKKLNLNTLAKQVTLLEAGKASLSIAQVKEVLRCLADTLASNEALAVFLKYVERKAKKGSR